MLSVAAFGVADLSESIAYAEQALRGLGKPPPESRLGALRAVLGASGRRVVGLAVPQRWRPVLSREASEVVLEASLAWNQLSTLYFFAGDPTRTLAAILRGLAAAERCGADAATVQSYANLGFVFGTARAGTVARHYFGQAQRVARRRGDTRGRALALYLEAMHCVGLARWQETRALGIEAAELFESISDAHEAEISRTIAAHGFYYAGDVVGADEQIEHVRRMASRRSNAQHVGWAKFMSARSLLARGEAAQAFALASAAKDLIEHLPDTLSNVMLDGTLARAALHCGNTAVATAACRRLTGRLNRGEWPATGQCVDGVAAAAEVLFWLRQAGGDVTPELRLAMQTLRRFALLFPIAAPAFHRARARLSAAAGHEAAAQRAWQRSLAIATRLHMPLEQALVHLDQASLARSAERRTSALAEARAVLRPLGCELFVELNAGGRPRDPAVG